MSSKRWSPVKSSHWKKHAKCSKTKQLRSSDMVSRDRVRLATSATMASTSSLDSAKERPTRRRWPTDGYRVKRSSPSKRRLRKAPSCACFSPMQDRFRHGRKLNRTSPKAKHYTIRMASPSTGTTARVWYRQRISMSSSLLPRARARLCARCSLKDVD